MYDFIISGAGPAGSKCAEIIANNGYKVALIEQDTLWRNHQNIKKIIRNF